MSSSTERSDINNHDYKQNVPELRYGSFEDEWEEKYLKDVCVINPKTEVPEIFNYIDLESVNSGILTDAQKIRKNDAPSRAQRKLDKKDILFATVRPYQQNNYYFNLDGTYVASTGYAQIKAKENSQYLYYFLHTKQFLNEVMKRCTGTSYPAINSNDLKTIKIKIPSNNEQKKIASLFSYLDQKIELMEKKYTLLEKYYKSLIHQMYVSKQDIPKITFSNKNWKEISLKEILEEIINKSTENNQYPLLSSTVNGIFLQKEYFDRNIGSKNNTGYKIISKNEIVFSPQNLWMGNINVNDKFEKGIVSPSYKIFKTNKKVRINFLKHLLKTKRMIYEYKLSSEQGASIVRRNLNMNLFLDIKIKIPAVEEQEKIASLMEYITTHRDNIKKEIKISKEFKRTMLSKMFC